MKNEQNENWNNKKAIKFRVFEKQPKSRIDS